MRLWVFYFFLAASLVCCGWLCHASLNPAAERPIIAGETPLRTHSVGLLVASWYGPGFEGKVTANGTVYNPSGLTCAHRTLPFGTRLLLGLGGKWVEVVVTDRGPVPPERDLDVSEGAAVALGFRDAGVAILEAIQLEKK